MSVIVLCGDPNSEGAPDDAIFITKEKNIVEELKKHKTGSVGILVFEECGLSRLFRGETPVTPIWEQFYRVLEDKGELLITDQVDLTNDSVNNTNFRVVIQHLMSKFFMYKHNEAGFHFHKIVTLHPGVVSPSEIQLAVRDKKRLEGPFITSVSTRDKEICTIMKGTKKILGSGQQGSVYHVPEWRSDVVVKVLEPPLYSLGDLWLEVKISENGGRRTDDILEVLSSAMLQDLTSGKSKFGHSMHIPRFEMFFACETPEKEHKIYLVEELLDFPLSTWCIDKHLNPAPYTAYKTMIWQCLYTMIFLNRMGWSHGDASHRNFMVAQVGDPYYVNNVNVGGATEWIYKLDGKTWKLKNTGWIAKISDFGFMQHMTDPRITWFENHWLESHRVPTTKVAKGADIGYFLALLGQRIYSRNTGNRELLQSMAILYNDWFKLLGVPEKNHMDFFYRCLDGNNNVSYLILPSARITEQYEDIDVSGLLNSRYFNEVISH